MRAGCTEGTFLRRLRKSRSLVPSGPVFVGEGLWLAPNTHSVPSPGAIGPIHLPSAMTSAARVLHLCPSS